MSSPVLLCLRTGRILRDGFDPIKPHTIRFRLLTAFFAHLDRPIPKGKLVDEVYGNCRTPMHVNAVIDWAVSDLRKWLAGSEWSIHTWHGWAYELKRSSFEFRGVMVDRPQEQPAQHIA